MSGVGGLNESPSVPVGRVTRRAPYVWNDGARGIEIDIGDYQVCVRWDWLGAELPLTTCAMLQICRADGGSVFDWRHLQEIKNAVCGPEWEAVEIFPAESRLKDPSNARYLWAHKGRLPFGLPGGRVVFDAHEAIAPQRPLASRPAFTLIELLAMIAVIGILLAIIAPQLSGAREAARDAACLADLRSIGQLVREYHGAWRTYPLDWDTLELPEGDKPRRCVRDRRDTSDDSHGLWSPVAFVPGRLKFDAWVEAQNPPGPLMASDLTVLGLEWRNGVWRDGSARRIR